MQEMKWLGTFEMVSFYVFIFIITFFDCIRVCCQHIVYNADSGSNIWDQLPVHCVLNEMSWCQEFFFDELIIKSWYITLNCCSTRTARERWKLFKNISKISLQRNRTTDDNEVWTHSFYFNSPILGSAFSLSLCDVKNPPDWFVSFNRLKRHHLVDANANQVYMVHGI